MADEFISKEKRWHRSGRDTLDGANGSFLRELTPEHTCILRKKI